MTEIVVCSFQFHPKDGDKEHNLNKVIKNFKDTKADVLLLPEFFSTGICHESFLNAPEDVNGGETIERLSSLAIQTNSNIICGSVVEKDGNNLYNTCFVLNRKGQRIAKYRKMHLFNMYGGLEHTRVTSGESPIVAKLDCGNVGLSICFDIRYPMHYLELKNKGADFCVCPTAWGYTAESEKLVDWANLWSSLNVSRANENQMPFVSCNEIGSNKNGFTCIGKSMILDKDGKIIKKANSNDECLISASINI